MTRFTHADIDRLIKRLVAVYSHSGNIGFDAMINTITLTTKELAIWSANAQYIEQEVKKVTK